MLVVNCFAMQVDVQTFDLDFRRDAQAHDHVDHLQDDEGDDAAVQEHRAHVVELDQHLVGIAIGQPTLAGAS